jgi:hypothetical protein
MHSTEERMDTGLPFLPGDRAIVLSLTSHADAENNTNSIDAEK